MAPIVGVVHSAYLPGQYVVGISKLARVLHACAHRLQVQERLTSEVANCIWEHLRPQGVAVVVEATHGCMTGRGVRTPNVVMKTSRMLGVFRNDEKSPEEVLKLYTSGTERQSPQIGRGAVRERVANRCEISVGG